MRAVSEEGPYEAVDAFHRASFVDWDQSEAGILQVLRAHEDVGSGYAPTRQHAVGNRVADVHVVRMSCLEISA